jgi:hypothetical protein
MSRSFRARLALAPLIVSGLAATGCAQELPDPRLIESTRPLAIRVEVTSSFVMDDPEAATRCQALPFDTVSLTPWIVGPEGPVDLSTIDPVWIACQLNPGQGLFGCIQSKFPTTLDEIPVCEPPDLMGLDPGMIPPAQTPCLIGRAETPDFVVPFNSSILTGGDIEITMIGRTPADAGGDHDTDECARVFLDGDHEVPDDCIVAIQRLELGPLEQLLLLADQFGIDLGDIEPPDPEDVPDFDRNPRISRFQVAVLDEDGEPGELVDVAPGDTIEASIGDTLRIEISVPEEDVQVYLQPINADETEEATESLDGDFFRTWGRLLSGSVDDPEGYNEWTLEREDFDDPERPDNDIATLFVTMRDDRVGVEWTWFNVDVSE